MLGRWRLGIRPDSDATRDRLVALLGRYLDTSGEMVRTNFSVRAPGRWPRRRPGRLYVAGDLVLETTELAAIVHRLVGHLNGIADDRGRDDDHDDRNPTVPDDHPLDRGGDTRPVRSVAVSARVAACGDRAVLVALPFSQAIPPAETRAGEAVEVPMWRPRIDLDAGEIIAPPALGDLDWRAAKLPAPRSGAARYRLVGVVTRPDRQGNPLVPPVWSDGRGDLDEWGVRLSLLHQEGGLAAAWSPDEVRAAVAHLLDTA